jgi:nucleotide-binding universal stress UspA family protein
MSGHRATGRLRWLNRCVTERVAQHSPVPILILREGGPTLTDVHHTSITAQHILVPLDGSTLAEAALAPAASLAALSHSMLHLIHVVHPDEVKKDACALKAAHRYLSTIVARHALGQETICSVAVHADVVTALIVLTEQGKPAKEEDGESRCDLIALATHGRSGVQRLILGSVTERVFGSAMVPLLIVRPLAQHAHEQPNIPLLAAH